MARYYYCITSAKPLKVEKDVNKHRTVRIKGVTEIIESGNNTDSYSNIKAGKRDIITNILMTFALADLILFILVLLVADFFDITIDNLSMFTSNYIASAGMLSTVYSFPRVRRFIGKKVFLWGEYGNKLYIWVSVLILSVGISAALYSLGLTDSLANTISMMCVVISLKNMQ